MQLYAARGFALAYINPRGSLGYDESFAGDVTGAWGEADAPDFLAAIDHVLACLQGEAINQLTPASVLDSLKLTLDVHQAVNRREGNTPATTAR